jgi:hypothetical protein
MPIDLSFKASGIRGATSSSGTLQAAQGIPAPPAITTVRPFPRPSEMVLTDPTQCPRRRCISSITPGAAAAKAPQLCGANASIPLEMKVKLGSNPGQQSIRSNTVSSSDGKSNWHSSILSGPIGFLRRPNAPSTARRCALFCYAELTSYPIVKGVASAVP